MAVRELTFWNRRTRKRTLDFLRRLFAYAVTTLFAILFTIPFMWMLSLSLKTPPDLARIPPRFIPKPIDWHNYVEAMQMPMRPFSHFLKNTIYYTGVALVGQVLSCTLVAYGFSRLRFPGRNQLFLVLLSTMMLPSQVLIIPRFIIFKELGWLNSFKPLIVPAYLGSPLYIFLLRQFFMTVPRELDEAAFLDGASRFTIFYRILVPLSRPILMTIIAFSFISHWNDFFGPLLYLNDIDKMVMSVGLAYFRDSIYTEIDLMMAASVVFVSPIILVFLMAQRAFITGITLTGMKEG
jgi:ABC-type glycerol-3-phosphate transport system permease component